MSEATVEAQTRPDLIQWRSLSEIAVRGLQETYSQDDAALPYTRRWDGQRASRHGRSVRYALISLLGLAKARAFVGMQEEFVARLWKRIGCAGDAREFSVGDLGLGLWARALHGGEDEHFRADRALRAYRSRAKACDSCELAWLLLGADHALLNGLASEEAEQLATEAKRALLGLYNPDTKLFYRHGLRGLSHRVSRRVACFANQIYPVLALAVHARRTGCPEAAAAANCVADKLCGFQGELGQWWWMYDVGLGQVVDGYPVFSVHQDGMAPMALLEVERAGGRRYTEAIERGLRWIFGRNELHFNLVIADQGLVLRDIHRRGVGRVRRMVRAALWCRGWRGDGRGSGATGPFVVNPECRPYHLGWLLYAAGLVWKIGGARGDP